MATIDTTRHSAERLYATTEGIRRDLALYRLRIEQFQEVIQHQAALEDVAEFLLEFYAPFGLSREAKVVHEKDLQTNSVGNPEFKVKMEGKQAEAEPENQANEAHIVNEKKRLSTESELRLPEIFIEKIDGHDCECIKCKPEITDERLKEAIEYVKQMRIAEFEEQYKAEIRARVEQEARAEKAAEAKAEYTRKYYNQIKDEVLQDIRTQMHSG